MSYSSWFMLVSLHAGSCVCILALRLLGSADKSRNTMSGVVLVLLGVLVLGASHDSLQSWQFRHFRHLYLMCTTLFIACSLVTIDGRSGLMLILYE